MNKRFVLLVAVVLAGFLITGCMGGGGKPGSSYTLSGSVVEKGTNHPIGQIEVLLGTKHTTTDNQGRFEFTNVEAGTHTVEISVDGYERFEKPVNVNRNLTGQKFELVTSAPQVNINALEGITDGEELDQAKIRIAGNVNDILTPRSEVGSLTTAITIDQLQAIINGTVYEIRVESDGDFDQVLPLDPGSNTIQLRVFDDHGHAGTSAILRVTVTLPRIDLRVILSWDTEGTDVDLHMFQRTAAEGNVVADYDYWASHDLPRHVCYWNKRPEDFGNGPTENPALDIDDMDGFGPETILLQKAASGHYHIWVHYYDADSYGFGEVDSKATVRIVVNGGTNDPKIYERVHTLTEDWEVWYVGTIVMPSGQLIQVPPAQNN